MTLFGLRISSVGFVAFPDEDLDALQVGGTISWGAPPDITYNQDTGKVADSFLARTMWSIGPKMRQVPLALS